MDILKRTWAQVDLDAVAHNFRSIKAHIGEKKLCCVIKADGYGHGSQRLSKFYSQLGCDFFAVSNIDEAVEIRQCGVKEPILILGFTPVCEVQRLQKYNITQVVFGSDYAKALSEKCVQEGVMLDVHIKIDTGMSRLGFMCQSFPEDLSSIDEIEKVCGFKNLCAKGIMAHFAVADEGEAGREYTERQIKAFKFTVDALKARGIEFELVHHSNSGGTEFYEDAHFNMVRAGIILYGLEPNPEIKSTLGLIPVMTLKSSVASVKEIRKGTDISYGRTFTASEDMKVAVVTIGYADGYFRSLSKDGYMGIRGKKAKILGRICMDQTIIDVTDIDDVKIGDEVTVFSGDESSAPSADTLAKMAGTINYEIVCAVSKRVPREYTQNGQIVDVMYKI